MKNQGMLIALGLLAVLGVGYVYYKDKCPDGPEFICNLIGGTAGGDGDGGNGKTEEKAPAKEPEKTPPPKEPDPPAAPDLKAKILSASKGDPAITGGKASAHIWNYYRNTLAPPALSVADFVRAFPNGTDLNQWTLDEFLAAVKAAGLSGFGGLSALSANRIPVWMIHGGYR